MKQFSESDKKFLHKLFKEQITVREMAEVTGFDMEDILMYLTTNKYWSKYCSSCELRSCYDCPGFEKLGRLDIQDRIDLLAQKNGDS